MTNLARTQQFLETTNLRVYVSFGAELTEKRQLLMSQRSVLYGELPNVSKQSAISPAEVQLRVQLLNT
jgi:hypothetical protein